MSLSEALDALRIDDNKQEAPIAVKAHTPFSKLKNNTKPRCELVRELNLPCGQVVESGSTITKSWLVKNSGTRDWPSTTYLQLIDGVLAPKTLEGVPVPSAQAGQEVQIDVVIRVPKDLGFRTGTYRLFDVSDAGEHRAFGPLFNVELAVRSEHTPSTSFSSQSRGHTGSKASPFLCKTPSSSSHAIPSGVPRRVTFSPDGQIAGIQPVTPSVVFSPPSSRGSSSSSSFRSHSRSSQLRASQVQSQSEPRLRPSTSARSGTAAEPASSVTRRIVFEDGDGHQDPVGFLSEKLKELDVDAQTEVSQDSQTEEKKEDPTEHSEKASPSESEDESENESESESDDSDSESESETSGSDSESESESEHDADSDDDITQQKRMESDHLFSPSSGQDEEAYDGNDSTNLRVATKRQSSLSSATSSSSSAASPSYVNHTKRDPRLRHKQQQHAHLDTAYDQDQDSESRQQQDNEEWYEDGGNGSGGSGFYDEIKSSDLQFGPKIGQGAFGEVYKGTVWGQEVALKKLKMEQISGELVDNFYGEVEIMRNIRHPHITEFLGACYEENFLCMVTEFLPNGSLEDYLVRLAEKERIMSVARVLNFASQIARGMSWLHHKGIIHRDLKTANILMTSNNTLKIADFGLSHWKSRTMSETGFYGFAGTPCYTAPEVIQKVSYGVKADVFSFGIIMAELLTGKYAFDVMENAPEDFELFDKALCDGLRPTLPSHTPPLLKELIEECWHHDPDFRPSMVQVIERLSLVAKSQAVTAQELLEDVPPNVRELFDEKEYRVTELQDEIKRLNDTLKRSEIACYEEEQTKDKLARKLAKTKAKCRQRLDDAEQRCQDLAVQLEKMTKKYRKAKDKYRKHKQGAAAPLSADSDNQLNHNGDNVNSTVIDISSSTPTRTDSDPYPQQQQ